MSDTDVDILLIEDNPGDARLIEELLPLADSLLHRVESGAVAEAGTIELRTAERLDEGLAAIEEATPDVVLLDLGLPDSRGLATLTTVLEETSFVPVVVLTGLSDEETGIEAIQQGAQEYLVKDEVTADMLVRTLYHAIERNRQERARAERRNELAALNRLNQVGQDVTHAVISVDSKDELERAVCERIVDSERYAHARIGGFDRRTDELVFRTDAGDDRGYLDAVDDADDFPTRRAAATQETQVRRGIEADAADASWAADATDHGFHGVAAVPILYQGFPYGVLTILATTHDAFSPPAVEILERLGDIIAHAITALERKDALLDETVLQLEFDVTGKCPDLVEATASAEGGVMLEQLVVDERILAYGRARDIDVDLVDDCLSSADVVDEHRILAGGDDWCRFEAAASGFRPLADAVTVHGGAIRGARIENGAFRLIVEFPTGRDKRQLIDLVEEAWPAASHHAQRTVERRPEEVAAATGALNGDLTDKQRTALEVAYHGGFFDWPRRSSGQELADRLDIAPATFSQHIRSAERKVFSAIFESAEATPDPPRPNVD